MRKSDRTRLLCFHNNSTMKIVNKPLPYAAFERVLTLFAPVARIGRCREAVPDSLGWICILNKL